MRYRGSLAQPPILKLLLGLAVGQALAHQDLDEDLSLDRELALLRRANDVLATRPALLLEQSDDVWTGMWTMGPGTLRHGKTPARNQHTAHIGLVRKNRHVNKN